MSDHLEPQRLIVGTVCEECGQITIPPQIIPGEDGEVKVRLFERCCLRCKPVTRRDRVARRRPWWASVWVLAACLWVTVAVLLFLIYRPH